MVLAAGVGRAWYYSFDWRKGLAKGRFRKEGERDKKWCGSRRGGNKEGGKESRTPGRDGKRPASQPILCVCAPRSVKERKETERPFPSGLAGLTTEESRFSGLVWGRPGLGEMIMQAHWETRPATAGQDSPALNECPCLWEGVSQKACCYSRQGMPMPEWEHWLCEWYEVGAPAGPGGFTLLLSHSCLGSNGRMGQRVSFSSSEVGIRAVSPEILLGLSSIERFRPRGRTTSSRRLGILRSSGRRFGTNGEGAWRKAAWGDRTGLTAPCRWLPHRRETERHCTAPVLRLRRSPSSSPSMCSMPCALQAGVGMRSLHAGPQGQRQTLRFVASSICPFSRTETARRKAPSRGQA